MKDYKKLYEKEVMKSRNIPYKGLYEDAIADKLRLNVKFKNFTQECIRNLLMVENEIDDLKAILRIPEKSETFKKDEIAEERKIEKELRENLKRNKK